MANRETNIPINDGILFNDAISKYPKWMKTTLKRDSLGDFVSLLTSLQIYSIEKNIENYYNSYGSTCDIGSRNLIYEVVSDSDFLTTDILSGTYVTNLGYSGTVPLYLLNDINDFDEYVPTRFTYEDEQKISTVTTSGQALCYTEVTAVSGMYYFSQAGDPSIYTLSEAFRVLVSGNLHTYYVDEPLDFVRVSGEWQEAPLSHTPSNIPMIYDIYNEGVTISGTIYQSGAYYTTDSKRQWFGQLRTRYEYKDFSEVATISTNRVIHNINQDISYPTFATGPTLERIYPKRLSLLDSDHVLFSAGVDEVAPGETVLLEFSYDRYNVIDQALSGTYEIAIAGDRSVLTDSVRILTTSSTEDIIYYDGSTGYFSLQDYGGLTGYGNVPSEDYTVESDDTHLLIRNYTALAGPFKVLYYTQVRKTYVCPAFQSYAPNLESDTTAYFTPYYKEYTIEEDVLVPRSIIRVEETNSDILAALHALPMDRFKFNVKRWRKGIAYDPFYKNYWVLQQNDVLYNLELPNKKFYLQNILDGIRYTYLVDLKTHTGWQSASMGSDFWYKKIIMKNYSWTVENPYYINNMTLYGPYLAMIASRPSERFVLLVNRFNPEQITVYPILGTVSV